MQQLQDVVPVKFVELEGCSLDAFIEILWLELGQLDRFLDVLPLSELAEADFSFISSFHLVEVLWIHAEEYSKHVFCPLNAVQSLFREHFQSAVRDLLILFRI